MDKSFYYLDKIVQEFGTPMLKDWASQSLFDPVMKSMVSNPKWSELMNRSKGQLGV
jgi:hypothetical protein